MWYCQTVDCIITLAIVPYPELHGYRNIFTKECYIIRICQSPYKKRRMKELSILITHSTVDSSVGWIRYEIIIVCYRYVQHRESGACCFDDEFFLKRQRIHRQETSSEHYRKLKIWLIVLQEKKICRKHGWRKRWWRKSRKFSFTVRRTTKFEGMLGVFLSYFLVLYSRIYWNWKLILFTNAKTFGVFNSARGSAFI